MITRSLKRITFGMASRPLASSSGQFALFRKAKMLHGYSQNRGFFGNQQQDYDASKDYYKVLGID